VAVVVVIRYLCVSRWICSVEKYHKIISLKSFLYVAYFYPSNPGQLLYAQNSLVLQKICIAHKSIYMMRYKVHYKQRKAGFLKRH